MSSATLKSATAELLERLHKTVRMGADSTMALLPKPDKEATGLKSELTVCLDGYEKFTHRIEALLREGGEQALNDSLWNKMTAKVGVAMSTLTDTSPSHLASMVIEGATMSMKDSIKLLREFENTDASEASLALVRDVIAFEEKNIEQFKRYL